MTRINAMTLAGYSPAPIAFDDIMKIADVLARSGYFQDAKAAAQAAVKIMYGQEHGIPPVTAMKNVHIINGTPTLGAGMIAAMIKSSGKYNYRVSELSDAACTVVFYEYGEQIGESRFTAQDAQNMKTQNMQRMPRNMLFARAITNGARWHTPDIFGGSVYSPEDFDQESDDQASAPIVDMPVEHPALPAPSRSIPLQGHAKPPLELKPAAKNDSVKPLSDTKRTEAIGKIMAMDGEIFDIKTRLNMADGIYYQKHDLEALSDDQIRAMGISTKDRLDKLREQSANIAQALAENPNLTANDIDTMYLNGVGGLEPEPRR